MTRDELNQKLVDVYGVELDEGILLADGFEDAFVGLIWDFNQRRACYDVDKCLAVLRTRDGMSEEDAEEYFEFNTLGAYVGESQPVYLKRVELA